MGKINPPLKSEQSIRKAWFQYTGFWKSWVPNWKKEQFLDTLILCIGFVMASLLQVLFESVVGKIIPPPNSQHANLELCKLLSSTKSTNQFLSRQLCITFRIYLRRTTLLPKYNIRLRNPHLTFMHGRYVKWKHPRKFMKDTAIFWYFVSLHQPEMLL